MRDEEKTQGEGGEREREEWTEGTGTGRGGDKGRMEEGRGIGTGQEAWSSVEGDNEREK